MFVEQGELRRGLQQRLMRVLAVHVEQQFAEFAQLRERDRRAVDPRLAAAARIDRPSHQHAGLVGAVDRLRLQPGDDIAARAKFRTDLGACRAFAHDVGVGAFAERQEQGVDQDRLAGAGLPGQHREAGREVEFERLDDDEVADCERQQHRKGQGLLTA